MIGVSEVLDDLVGMDDIDGTGIEREALGKVGLENVDAVSASLGDRFGLDFEAHEQGRRRRELQSRP